MNYPTVFGIFEMFRILRKRIRYAPLAICEPIPYKGFVCQLGLSLKPISVDGQQKRFHARRSIQKWCVSIFAYHSGAKISNRAWPYRYTKFQGNATGRTTCNAPGQILCRQKGNGCKSRTLYANARPDPETGSTHWAWREVPPVRPPVRPSVRQS